MDLVGWVSVGGFRVIICRTYTVIILFDLMGWWWGGHTVMHGSRCSALTLLSTSSKQRNFLELSSLVKI